MTAPVAARRTGVRKGDLRQRALVSTLDRLLAERPIGELSVEELAAGAGLSRSAFYFYFESKHAALAAAAGGLQAEMLEAFAPFLERQDEPPREALRRMNARSVSVWGEHRHLLGAVVESGPGAPRLRDLWSEWMGSLADVVARRIEEERRSGAARAGPPPARSLARTLLWANERNMYQAHTDKPSRTEVANLVDALTAIWLGAIYAEGNPR